MSKNSLRQPFVFHILASNAVYLLLLVLIHLFSLWSFSEIYALGFIKEPGYYVGVIFWGFYSVFVGGEILDSFMNLRSNMKESTIKPRTMALYYCILRTALVHLINLVSSGDSKITLVSLVDVIICSVILVIRSVKEIHYVYWLRKNGISSEVDESVSSLQSEVDVPARSKSPKRKTR